jgi:hypothetical protein
VPNSRLPHFDVGKQCYRLVRIFWRGDQVAGTSLEPSATICTGKLVPETRGNDLEHGKNAEDWIIRRSEPKPVMVGHGSVSEIAMASVTNEGLAILRLLKVRSSPLGNQWGQPWGGLNQEVKAMARKVVSRRYLGNAVRKTLLSSQWHRVPTRAYAKPAASCRRF